ncbi:MAG: hypothetical protein MI861_00820, partial [Pirellulales bacterium]|nr:hypothetical protein [Pirellulales bacterium]
DANGDGIVTRQEWAESGYSTPRHFFYHDLNGDGILTLYEHSIGVARWRRRNERRSDDRRQRENAARRTKETPAISTAVEEPPPTDPRIQARREQLDKLTNYLMEVYDVNQNRRLEPGELHSPDLPLGNLAGADRNHDGMVLRQEIVSWLENRSPPLSELSLQWQARDKNQDGQVSFAEFASNIATATAQPFRQWDRNGDGLITPRESEASLPKGQFTFDNKQTMVLKPRSSVVSELSIDPDLIIGHLKVDLQLNKANDNYTEVVLISPNRTRVQLYRGDGWQPWTGSQILNGVTFDQDAPDITKTLKQRPTPAALRPPGQGTLEDANLETLRGQSSRGTWRLVIRNQNDRVGLLVGWSLTIVPSSTVR